MYIENFYESFYAGLFTGMALGLAFSWLIFVFLFMVRASKERDLIETIKRPVKHEKPIEGVRL